MTTNAEALEVSCPLCKAKKNMPCVYINDQDKWVKITPAIQKYSSRTYYQSGPNYAKVHTHRKGEACKSVHNERRQKARNKQLQAIRQETPRPASTALQSLNAFDQQEYTQLRDWLRQNHTVFNFNN
jgi:hypothetical protein